MESYQNHKYTVWAYLQLLMLNQTVYWLMLPTNFEQYIFVDVHIRFTACKLFLA
jgi:hypothetical protein